MTKQAEIVDLAARLLHNMFGIAGDFNSLDIKFA